MKIREIVLQTDNEIEIADPKLSKQTATMVFPQQQELELKKAALGKNSDTIDQILDNEIDDWEKDFDEC